MWKKILIRLLPKFWEKSFLKIEKEDLITKALEACWKNKLIKATWKPFVKSVLSWLEDAKGECYAAMSWPDDDYYHG